MASTVKILREVIDERQRQDDKWGVMNHNGPTWSAVLGEEYGEVCQEVLRMDFGKKDAADLRKELIQVAAVAVAWIECLERRGR